MAERNYIGIVGSRDFEKKRMIQELILELVFGAGHKIFCTGDCPNGADMHVRDIFWPICEEDHDVKLAMHTADWETHGKAAGPIRS